MATIIAHAIITQVFTSSIVSHNGFDPFSTLGKSVVLATRRMGQEHHVRLELTSPTWKDGALPVMLMMHRPIV